MVLSFNATKTTKNKNNMKKFFTLSAIFATVALMSGCNDEEDSFHAIYINSDITTGNILPIYADQSGDTLRVQTTDSFEANADGGWVTFAETNSATISKAVNYAYGNVVTFKLGVKFSPNTSDATRYSNVIFKANGREAGVGYVQAHFHDILNPKGTYTDKITHKDIVFGKSVESTTMLDSIAFTLYDKATLSSDADWLTVRESSFEAGTHTVYLDIKPNDAITERTARLTLLSDNGAKSTIHITQK